MILESSGIFYVARRFQIESRKFKVMFLNFLFFSLSLSLSLRSRQIAFEFSRILCHLFRARENKNVCLL